MRQEATSKGFNLGERAIVGEVVPQVAIPGTDDQRGVAARVPPKNATHNFEGKILFKAGFN